MLNYQINPAYSSFEGIINNLRVTFQEIGTTIYKIRNEVKVIEYNGMKFCVKSFSISLLTFFSKKKRLSAATRMHSVLSAWGYILRLRLRM
jgi:hypothetical protein